MLIADRKGQVGGGLGENFLELFVPKHLAAGVGIQRASDYLLRKRHRNPQYGDGALRRAEQAKRRRLVIGGGGCTESPGNAGRGGRSAIRS